jgi:hypothetical protein
LKLKFIEIVKINKGFYGNGLGTGRRPARAGILLDLYVICRHRNQVLLKCGNSHGYSLEVATNITRWKGDGMIAIPQLLSTARQD